MIPEAILGWLVRTWSTLKMVTTRVKPVMMNTKDMISAGMNKRLAMQSDAKPAKTAAKKKPGAKRKAKRLGMDAMQC